LHSHCNVHAKQLSSKNELYSLDMQWCMWQEERVIGLQLPTWADSDVQLIDTAVHVACVSLLKIQIWCPYDWRSLSTCGGALLGFKSKLHAAS